MGHQDWRHELVGLPPSSGRANLSQSEWAGSPVTETGQRRGGVQVVTQNGQMVALWMAERAVSWGTAWCKEQTHP